MERNRTPFPWQHNSSKKKKKRAGDGMRESFPRQIDRKSRGPQGERSGILKEEERTNFLLFFPLHSLGLYNNNVI